MDRLGPRSNADDASRVPVRCELVPVPPRIVKKFLSPTTAKPSPPHLVLDVGTREAIRIIDADTKTLIASDWLPHVTAAPTHYRYAGENNSSYKQALLDVRIPNAQPLRIGTPPIRISLGAPVFRYGWRGWVRGHTEPTHVVTDTDWLALAERLGLGARVVDESAAGKIRRVKRVMATTWLWWGMPLFMLAGWVFHHFVR